MENISNKELVDLYNSCLAELKSGGHTATQQMLDYFGNTQKINDENIYKQIQLMLAQEEYVQHITFGPLKRDDDALVARLEQCKDEINIFINQIIKENERKAITDSTIQKDLEKYNQLAANAGYYEFKPENPLNYNASKIYCKEGLSYSSPFIATKHFGNPDGYAISTDNYFKSMLNNKLIASKAPIIHITPEQLGSIIKVKDVTNNNSIDKQDAAKSKLTDFLEKFAAKSADAAQSVFKPFKKPIPIATIQEGMEIIIPENCKNLLTGEQLPELKVEVLDVWQQGGQVVISTNAGLITNRDLRPDIHAVLQDKIADFEYKIEHADEIRAQEEEFKRQFDYKHKWFENMQCQFPVRPHDGRLDMNDLHHFGYTPETALQAGQERDEQWRQDSSAYDANVQQYSAELIAKCLENDIEMYYVGDYRDDFQYYGQTPDGFSPPDFNNGKIPTKYQHEIILPSTCTNVLTGLPLEYSERKMQNVWDVAVSQYDGPAEFALVGENIYGKQIMITSIDIREMAREMANRDTPEYYQTEQDEIEPADIEPDIGDR